MDNIVLISGSTGTGKTTVSRMLAEGSDYAKAVHLHTDDFYQYIRKGYIAPWRRAAGDQNETVVGAIAACARRYAADGYQVFVDGVIGPWFLGPWLEMVKAGMDVRYVVLRPSEAENVRRAVCREQRAAFPLDEGVVRELWRSLADLGPYEAHAVDTTGQTVAQSVKLLRTRLAAGGFRL